MEEKGGEKEAEVVQSSSRVQVYVDTVQSTSSMPPSPAFFLSFLRSMGRRRRRRSSWVYPAYIYTDGQSNWELHCIVV